MKKLLILFAIVLSSLLATNNLSAQYKYDTTYVNQYGVAVEHHMLNPETWNGIISFQSKDKGYRMWLDNRVYVDGAYYFDKNTYNPIGNGVTIRRARFAVKATIDYHWYGEIDLDFAYSKLEMKDMIVGYDFGKRDDIFSNIRIKAGNFKEGFSMEETTTSRYVTFIERSFMSKMTPSRHLGLQLTKFGKLGINYLFIGGVHFQDVGGAEEVLVSQARNKKAGMDEGYSLTGRLVLMPILNNDMVLHLGVAGSYRTPKTSWITPTGYRVSSRAMTSINRKKYLDTDVITNADHVTLTGLEFAFAWHKFMVQGEYTINNIFGTDVNDVKGIDKAHLEGAYAQIGWILFGGNYQYNRAEGEFTQINTGVEKRKFGALELAARYDYISLNDFDAKVYGGGGNGYTIGLNYYATHNVSFKLNYSYVDFDRYANYREKLYIGYDSKGNLTKDSFKVDASKGTPGERFGMIQIRCEIDF